MVPPSGSDPALADQLNVPLRVLNVATQLPLTASAGVPLLMTPKPVKVKVVAVCADGVSVCASKE